MFHAFWNSLSVDQTTFRRLLQRDEEPATVTQLKLNQQEHLKPPTTCQRPPLAPVLITPTECTGLLSEPLPLDRCVHALTPAAQTDRYSRLFFFKDCRVRVFSGSWCFLSPDGFLSGSRSPVWICKTHSTSQILNRITLTPPVSVMWFRSGFVLAQSRLVWILVRVH